MSVYQNEKLVGQNEYPLKHIYDVRLPLSYCQSGLKAIIIFIALWGCFFAGCVMLYCWFDTCHWKICGFFKKCGKNPYLYIAVFSMAWFAFLAWAAPANACVGDTTSYYADSFSELSWYYRMPVYQLLLMIVKRLSGVSEWTSAYIYVIQIQRIIAVIGILAFYDALKKIIKNHAAALIFTFFDAIAIGIWGYTDVIMTESLGISIMCLCVWSVMRLIVSKKKKYIVFSSILAMIGIWTRPSFIFIIPVLLLFFVIYGLYEKDRQGLILGISSIAVCGILLFAYCKNNERLAGTFMLSSVSYHNQLAIMLKGNLYVNDDYPDITQGAVERAQHPQYSLKDATDMCDLFGYARIAEYLQSCRRLYSKEYALYIMIRYIS